MADIEIVTPFSVRRVAGERRVKVSGALRVGEALWELHDDAWTVPEEITTKTAAIAWLKDQIKTHARNMKAAIEEREAKEAEEAAADALLDAATPAGITFAPEDWT